MCGCAARWIWPSTNKPSLIRSMKDTRKLRWRQCRRCNGRMTTRCKTRRDLEKAKALLKEAGYPNGFTLSLWSPHSIGTNPNPQLTAAMIQSDWGKIGVKARIASYEV